MVPMRFIIETVKRKLLKMELINLSLCVMGYYNLTSVLIFIVVLLLTHLLTRKPKGIPPGPPITLPLLGDLPLLFQGDIMKVFGKLRKHYGDIFSFYMGRELIIVINSYKLIQKAGVQKGNVFTDRPKTFLNNYTAIKGQGIVLASGKFWKSQRKFTQTSLQELGFFKSSFEDKILREVESFITVVKDHKGEANDIQEAIRVSIANVMMSILCSKHHNYGDSWVKTYLERLETATKVLMRSSILLQCLPFLKYVPGDALQVKVLAANIDFFKAYANRLYEERMKVDEATRVRDFIDLYINEIKRHEELREDSDFTKDQLSRLLQDLIGAGTGTTSTVIQWALLFLLHNTELKQRLQAHVDEVIPDNRLPCLADRTNLPLVEAFIMETLRFANVAPLAMPHCAAGENDVIFEGYRIPNESSIMFNIGTVLFDPAIFPDPFTFNPERFLDRHGNVFRPKELIPFGLGRRMCLGETVARMILFLFITAMIKEFDFLPESDRLPNLKGILTLSHAPVPFKVRAIRRSTKT